ncbi:hypothetical protein BS17DRAFT_778006 [Gyrodon lividus]|nr:hypothetical protein BS17DRAFT_778006 [Gyrodon lividus]
MQLVYVCWLAVEFLFLWAFLVETKNRTLEETAALSDGEDALQPISHKAEPHEVCEEAFLEKRVPSPLTMKSRKLKAPLFYLSFYSFKPYLPRATKSLSFSQAPNIHVRYNTRHFDTPFIPCLHPLGLYWVKGHPIWTSRDQSLPSNGVEAGVEAASVSDIGIRPALV